MSVQKTIPFVARDSLVPLDINGRSVELRIWTYEQWARIPVSEQPGQAREYRGVGYFEITPMRSN